MSEAGRLFVYSGPSGVGKGTVLTPYLAENPGMLLSVSMTTRAPRPGEVNGLDYFFVSREEFEQEIARGGLLEYAQYSGNYYGTPRAKVEDHLAKGRDVLLEIEVQGAMQVKESFPDAVLIFILPPAYETLRKRLLGRGTEPAEVVERRLTAAKEELGFAGRYDYVIINDDLEKARAQLGAVIAAAKCERRFMEKTIEKVCDFS